MSRDLNINYFQSESQRKDTVESIAKLLIEIIEENKRNNKDNKRTIFDSLDPPPLDIKKYIERIMKYCKGEESTIILALIYVDRICEKMKIQLSNTNIYKLIFVGFLLSIKMNEDDFYDNNFYSKVGGLTLEELNILEIDFFINSDFKLWVDIELYNRYKIYLNNYV